MGKSGLSNPKNYKDTEFEYDKLGKMKLFKLTRKSHKGKELF